MERLNSLLLRLCTDEDIEHVRQWMTPAERAVLFALCSGIKVRPAHVAKTFGITHNQASRLIRKIEVFANGAKMEEPALTGSSPTRDRNL
jgi:hypothetical protein